MNPYSGMFDLAEKKGLLKKEGNSYVYVTKAGETLKAFRKKWEKNEDGLLDILMADMAMMTDLNEVESSVNNESEVSMSEEGEM